MDNKKFIVTTDAEVANKMIAQKFKLLSSAGGVYTFVNETPSNFTFDAFDANKVHFTNKLCL